MRLSSLSTPRGRRRNGASAVEFGIVLPVLMLLALGCVDFGRFAYHHIAVQNAARAGAEYAIMNPYTSGGQNAWLTQVQQNARDEMANQSDVDTSLLTTTTTVTVEQSGLRRVRVAAQYTGFTTLVAWPGIPSAPTLHGTVEMRLIR
jgi:Flp pilus assembly protein TadG